jgi:biopolymer transport protein ExbD
MKVSNRRSGDPYHIQAEINMIPLIDVALVLLIIFMVISPILVESQLRVSLPKVSSAGKADAEPIKVEIAGDGSLAFQGKIVNRDQLRDAMRRQLPPGHQASLLIQADKDVAFDYVVFVMDLAKQLKVEKLGVAVLPQVGQ